MCTFQPGIFTCCDNERVKAVTGYPREPGSASLRIHSKVAGDGRLPCFTEFEYTL